MHSCRLRYGRRQKKFPFTVRTTEQAILFHFHLISMPLPFVPRPFSTRSRFVLRAARPFNLLSERPG